MSILPFPAYPATTVFDPESLRVLADAFDDAWKWVRIEGTTFQVERHAEQTREILARCIIEKATRGERDHYRLRDAALAHLAEFGKRVIVVAPVSAR